MSNTDMSNDASSQENTKDGTARTFLVAAVLCVVCSVIVSASAVMLKPIQDFNKDLDRKRNILSAAGLLKPDTDIEAAFSAIDIKLVNLKTGEFVEKTDSGLVPEQYNQRVAAKDPAHSISLNSSEDIAGIKRRAVLASVYLSRNAEGEVEKMILPVKGYGLWSTLYGFLALENDFRTIAGLGFYEHSETPGLGGEVDNPSWKAQWLGKKFVDEDFQPATTLYKGTVAADTPGADYKFDAISGATLTSRGVENLMRFWAGDQGFGPFLKRAAVSGV